MKCNSSCLKTEREVAPNTLQERSHNELRNLYYGPFLECPYISTAWDRLLNSFIDLSDTISTHTTQVGVNWPDKKAKKVDSQTTIAKAQT